MARIKITDLPLFQDLTEEQLKELFGAGARNFRPGIETLEDRQLMSATLLASSLSSTQQALSAPLTDFTSSLSSTTPVIAIQGQTTTTNPYAVIQNPTIGLNTTIDPSFQPVVQQSNLELFSSFNPGDPTIDYGAFVQQTNTPTLTPTNAPSTGNIGIQGNPSKLSPSDPLPASDQTVGEKAINAKINSVGPSLGQTDGDQEATNDLHGRLQKFYGGKAILWSPETQGSDSAHPQAWLVKGLILEEYVRAGGVTWGYPTSDAYVLPGRTDALAQYFWDESTHTGKMIVWTQPTGAHAMEGPIMQKYLALGGGDYGVPISSIYDLHDLHDRGARGQDFRYGNLSSSTTDLFSTIVTSRYTGTHDIYGSILTKWQANRWVGLPTTDNTSSNTLIKVVHFRSFTGEDPHDSAIGTPDGGGSAYYVTGEIYTAWISASKMRPESYGMPAFGIPIHDEQEYPLASVSKFVSLDGRIVKTIAWYPGGSHHFFQDEGLNDLLDFTPIGGPTGLEHPVATGTTSAPLTVSPTYQNLPYSQATDQNVLALLSGPQSPAYTPVATDALGMSLNSWNVTPVTDYTAFTGFDAVPADFDFSGINGTPIDPPAAVDASTVEGVTSGDADASQATPVAVVTNISFALTDDNGTAHQLLITVQTPQPDGSATFQGVWDADSGPGEPVAGTLAFDDAGNAHLTFSGANENFDGIIAGDPSSCHLDGTLTSAGADPVHIAGDQIQATDAFAAQPDTVSDAVNASGAALGATAGQAVTGPVATFTSTDPNAQAGDFTATILWDAADPNAVPDTSATVAYDQANQVFTVSSNYTCTLAGSHDVRVSIQHLGGAAAEVQTQVTVDAAAASQFVLSGVPNALSAGVAQQLTVLAQDAFGNTATGYTGSVRLSSSDKSAVLPAAYTFAAADQGSHTFALTLKTAGTQSLKVTDTTSSFSATVAGLAVNPAASLRLSAVPAKATAGAAFKVTVTALDAAGKTATAYRGKVQLSSSDGQAVPLAAYTFTAADKGAHSFVVTLKTAGSQWLKIVDQGLSSVLGQANLSVAAAAAKSFVVSNLATSVAVGAAQSVTLTVRDAYGNVVTGYVGAVSFTSTDKKAVLPARYTFKAADQGVHSFAVTFKTHGSQSLTIADAAAAVTFKQAGIAVA